MLRQLDDDLWCSDSSVRLPGGVHMPARMTVVRHAGGLWLHSPLPIDEAMAAAIAELGEVVDIVAPNCLHHLHVGSASERFAAARVHAPAGLRSKRPDLRIDHALASDDRWPAIAVVEIAGAPMMSEFVFIHRPSNTLICTDLLFNIREPEGFGLGLILRIVGAHRRLGQSKVWRRATKDRQAAAAAVARLLDHEITRLIPAHGDLLDGPDVHAQVADALAWMRAGKS